MAATLLLSSPSAAFERDLREPQPLSFYVTQGVLSATLLGSSWALRQYVHGQPARAGSWFGFEESVEDNFSEAAAGLSDALLLTTVAVPVVAQTGGTGTQFGNATLVYGETLSATLWLTTVAKATVRRARPYTHHPDPSVQAYAAAHPEERNLSFFSGHSSFAFSSFVGGSYLFSSVSDSPAARRTLWGLEAALAGATAHLRVRAGKHYYSDVIVGAVVGTGVGVLVPYWNGVRYELEGEDVAAMGTGLAIGVTAAAFAPADELAEPPKGDLVALRIRSGWLGPTTDGRGVSASVSGTW